MENKNNKAISFCILDDLEFMYGPITKQFSEKDNLKTIVRKLIIEYLVECGNSDPIDFFWEYDCKTQESREKCLIENIETIANKLSSQRYYVCNRWNKYYVVAFAIDFVRFEIYSKDCDKELINWGSDNNNGEIVERITDPEYNLNPVIRMLRNFDITNAEELINK
jgi:hypothetical protein